VVCAAAACAAWLAAPAVQAQLRIVDYNIAQNYDIQSDPGGLDLIFGAIATELRNGFARPIDVLAMQELNESGTDAAAIATMLNGVFGVSTYAAAPKPANAASGGNGLPALVYNSATVGLLETIAFGNVGSGADQQPRSTLRYRLRPAGYGPSADFYLYNSHYKSDTGATDQARRLVEATAIRDNADALGDGVHAIYAGDFNIGSSSESMYAELLSAGAGQAFDPIAAPGSWSGNLAFKPIHTQSPATGPAAFSGQVLGGVNDRFDFQLVTGELLDGEGLSYIPGSYHTFGNNGTHNLNGAITTGSGASAAVLTALTQSSDHLPVVADYQLPAKLGVEVGAVPPIVPVGAAASFNVIVQNLANVVAAIGADELDYTLSVTGDLVGGAAGTDAPLGGGLSHQVTLNTATAGTKSGVVTVTASSQGAANPLFTMPVSFVVSGGGAATRVTVARDDFDAPLNLVSFTQTPAAGAMSAGSGFEEYQFGVSPAVPAQLVDATASGTPGDTRGVFSPAAKTDAWFGASDTVNPGNPSGSATASWEFDVDGASSLEASIAMGAMGDFEAGADVFNWTYSLDGAAFQPLFTSSVDEAATANYTLASGVVVAVDDPLSMTTTGGQTVQLSNAVATLTSAIAGVGERLVVRLEVNANGLDEAFALDDIVVTGLVASFAAADFNHDGLVDGADLATWRTNFGQTGANPAQGDADDDGDVDGGDFLVWQREATAAGGAAAVPEPHSALLAAAAILLAVARRRGGR
jgi:hypothetical protein